MNVWGFLRGLLGRRDWVYLLSLLVPFVVYDLVLKALDVASVLEHGLSRAFDLMQSDVFFDLGYALLWLGLFAAARKGPARWIVLFLFHATTMLVLIVITCAHQYLQETGTTLDYTTIAEWIPKFKEIEPLFFEGGTSPWAVLFVILFYAVSGPWLVRGAVERWRRRGRSSGRATLAEVSLLGFVGLWLLAIGFGSLSLVVSSGPAGANTSLAREPFVNVVVTGVGEATTQGDNPDAGPATRHPAEHASLAPTSRTEKRNVVLIHLESTRAQSVTPYNEDLKTTPFLDELAKESLLAEQAHVVIPRTSKGSVAVNCGVDPPSTRARSSSRGASPPTASPAS